MHHFFQRFWHDARGVLGPAMAVMLPVIVTSVGVSVDLSRSYIVHDRLSRALDAAALAAGSSSGDEDAIAQRFEDFFNANYPEGALGDPYNLNIVQTDDSITVSAQANVDTTFMRIAGFTYLTVSASATVRKALRGLEVALVLDNTGSMWGNNNIGALRDAARDFVDIIYDRVDEDDQVFIGIVPYAASVNPGAEAVGIVDNPFAVNWLNTPYAPYSATDWSAWRGCVFERPYPHDIEDTSTAAGGLWRPYRWPDTPASGTPGDNNWLNNNGTLNLNVPSPNSNSNAWRHPNLGCPTPIVPLTNDRTRLQNEIAALTAWNRGGTLGNVGLAWGVRVLSPDPPFTQGRDFSSDQWRKVLVMMTDGNNEIYCEPTGWTGGCNDTRSDETAFRRVGAGILGTTSRAGALAVANARMAEACTYAKSLGITVYTITFSNSLNNTTRALYRDCASDANKYYNAPTQGDLVDAFQQISRELSNLHLAE